MVRVVGIWALKLAELKLIRAPPVGAGAANVTVPPVGLMPPTTALGEMLTLTKSAGLTVIFPLAEFPLTVAEIVAVCIVEFEIVAIVNDPDVRPAGTVIVAPTVATEVFELVKVSVSPDGPAGDESTTVPIALLPPTTV